jgi:hypothetical protein
MISMRFLFLIFFVAALVTLSIAPSAYSGSAVKDCSTVSELARLEYDSRLAVLMVEDDDADACYFIVTAPAADNSSAAATAAALVQEAKLGKIEPQNIVGPILDALSAPLDRKAFISPAYEKLFARLKEQLTCH